MSSSVSSLKMNTEAMKQQKTQMKDLENTQLLSWIEALRFDQKLLSSKEVLQNYLDEMIFFFFLFELNSNKLQC